MTNCKESLRVTVDYLAHGNIVCISHINPINLITFQQRTRPDGPVCKFEGFWVTLWRKYASCSFFDHWHVISFTAVVYKLVRQ